MVYDKIDNIDIYKGLSSDIYEALKFLQHIAPDVEKGVYELSPRVKAIVSEYETKEVNEYGYEAHREYIDIQYLLKGEERIACMPIERLKETKPYNKECDAAFYDENEVKPQEMLLGNSYFAILFPQDGHMPCLCTNEPVEVKKVVVKVHI